MERLFLEMLEHNDWANRVLMAACAELSDSQMDAAPHALLGPWSVRTTLLHLADAQRGYLEILAGAGRPEPPRTNDAESIARSLRDSGEGLAAFARDDSSLFSRPGIRTGDGYVVAPWVVLVQAINHAHDHRRQVCGLLRALGRTPPRIDGWGFGEAVGAVTESR